MVFVPTGSPPANANNFGHPIDRSLRLNPSDSAYLSPSQYLTDDGQTFTFEVWFKRSELGSGDILSFVSTTGAAQQCGIGFSDYANQQLSIWQYAPATYQYRKVLARKFRDPSQWYHLVVAFDTTNAVAEDRIRIFVNGVRETAFSVNTNPAQNLTSYFANGSHYAYLGCQNRNNGFLYGFGGYIAGPRILTGTALDADDFGEFNATTGEWVPKEVTGLTYGTNGFYLPFSDNTNTTTLGEDSSGNGNDWTLNNLATTDSVTDTPTNNWCVLNSIDGGSGSLLNGNLQWAANAASGRRGNFGMSSGKWYWEVVLTVGTNPAYVIHGIQTSAGALSGYGGTVQIPSGYGYLGFGNKINNTTSTAYGNSFTTNDIIGVAFDADNGKIWFAKNGVWQASGNPATDTNPAFTGITANMYFPYISNQTTSNNDHQGHINFGQLTTTGDNADENGFGSFEYAPPAGFLALCSANLPDPTIIRPRNHFDTVLYTGDGVAIGSGGQSVTGDETWTPGFAWIKNRDATDSHMLFDEVRGATNYLESDTTDDETTDAESLTSFDAGGFTVGSNVAVNTNTEDFVAWLWKGAGSASNNTTGDITSSVSVNATAGISIGTYTGTGTSGHTIGHGLGDAPGLILVKARTTASTNTDWAVYHHENTSAPETDHLHLNTTAATADDAGFWNDTAPTSTVFSVGNNAAVNTASDTYGFLAFAEVPGLSKFGTYEGNNSTDGPFVWCGFRPAFVMAKNASAGSQWVMIDATRDTYNVTDARLRANTSAAEVTETFFDFVSNGFKVRGTGTDKNDSGNIYIFAAFADIPFKYARAR